MIRDGATLLSRLHAIHGDIREAVVGACERQAVEQLAQPLGEAAGDTCFAIDRVSEEVLLAHFRELAQDWPLLLVAEGLGTSGQVVLPAGATPEIVVIVDPIDGTRGLMYQKRPGWVLTGVAPFHGVLPTLADIELALQTEIPLVKQHLCDTLWVSPIPAGMGAEVGGERLNRLTGERRPLTPRPSQMRTIAQGFGNLVRFFPGARAQSAAIDDQLVERVLGAAPPGRALAFEDQYISTGGQLYELLMGHDRWLADLRAQVPGFAGLGCHPYDLCTELIARAAGANISDPSGRQLAAPLDTHTGVAWVGFANAHIRAQVMPVLQTLLLEHGWL